jgi:RimJ/RimL family protein N-acetyltransferase
VVSAAARRSGGPLSDDAAHHRWEGYCSAAELAFTVPGIERVGIHHDKASQASAGVPRSSGCRPIGEQPDTPSAPAGHGTGCTWRITRDEWLSAR